MSRMTRASLVRERSARWTTRIGRNVAFDTREQREDSRRRAPWRSGALCQGAVHMKSRPHFPPHPGEILEEWMSGKRADKTDTAALLSISIPELERVLAGNDPLPATIAVRLEHIGWGLADSWLGTQAVWEIDQARKQLSLPPVRDYGFPHRAIDLGFNIYSRTERAPKASYRPPCASIVIACKGQRQPNVFETRFGEIRSRSGAQLKYTARDAEGIWKHFKKREAEIPDDLHILLIDPKKSQVHDAIRTVSKKIRQDYGNGIGLDFAFAGHGCQVNGDLVLSDGVLSSTDFLKLQAEDVAFRGKEERTVGVWLDSCYSGAFLIRLAIESFEDFEGFKLDNGLASCLPSEECFEMGWLQHGVFSYTRLYPGNKHVDRIEFNEAVLSNRKDEIAKGLQGLVSGMSNPSAFLTEARQFSVGLYKHVIDVHGDFATVELGDESDFDEICASLTNFKFHS